MWSNLKWILGTVLAVLMFAGGYSFGARKVTQLEAQIAKLQREGEEAEVRLKNVQGTIDKALKDKEAEYARQVARLKADSDRKAKDLGAALAASKARTAELQNQLGAIDARRAKLQAAMNGASPTEKQKLQEQLDALDGQRRAVSGDMDANACLALAVPKVVVEPLNR